MADLEARVREELDRMRPFLAKSGASAELVGVEDNVAKVRLHLTRPRPGRAVASLQVASGLERILRDKIPELRTVEAVNLPPFSLLGWDQPDFTMGELPAEEPPAR
ncbi:MAG TPA: NifU family protein [Candidatus Limnocylindria bacterium]|nr:NifU family protein [Candidatus Limnocylindria bacterium]